MGTYVLTAEILIAGFLADDDAAMDGYYDGAVSAVADVTTPISHLVSDVAQLPGAVRA